MKTRFAKRDRGLARSPRCELVASVTSDPVAKVLGPQGVAATTEDRKRVAARGGMISSVSGLLRDSAHLYQARSPCSRPFAASGRDNPRPAI
jgi:hypothetical protein